MTWFLLSYAGVGLVFALLASVFSGHKLKDSLSVFLWIALGWPWIVPRAYMAARRSWRDAKK